MLPINIYIDTDMIIPNSLNRLNLTADIEVDGIELPYQELLVNTSSVSELDGVLKLLDVVKEAIRKHCEVVNVRQ